MFTWKIHPSHVEVSPWLKKQGKTIIFICSKVQNLYDGDKEQENGKPGTIFKGNLGNCSYRGNHDHDCRCHKKRDRAHRSQNLAWFQKPPQCVHDAIEKLLIWKTRCHIECVHCQEIGCIWLYILENQDNLNGRTLPRYKFSPAILSSLIRLKGCIRKYILVGQLVLTVLKPTLMEANILQAKRLADSVFQPQQIILCQWAIF